MDLSHLVDVTLTLLAAAPQNITDVFKAKDLLTDVSNWVGNLLPVGGGLMVAYHALMRNTAQDENTGAQHTKSIRTVVIGTVIGTAAAKLIAYATSYIGT